MHHRELGTFDNVNIDGLINGVPGIRHMNCHLPPATCQ